MTKRERKKLRILLKKWTKCEIYARLMPFIAWPDWGAAYQDKWQVEEQIRELLYGTSDLVELGQKWGLSINPPKKPKRKKSTKHHHIGRHDNR